MSEPDKLPCEDVREGLSALLDGEVEAAEEAALRHHLAHCARCAAYERGLRELEAQMERHLIDRRDEDAIWARVQRGMDADSAPAGLPGRRLSSPIFRWATAAVLVIGLALGSWQALQPESADGSILAATAQDFSEFRSSGVVLDVAAAHPKAVLRWMTARVDFELPQRIAGPAGLEITGGRLCSFLNRKLAFFAYNTGSEEVGLYVMRAEGLEVPPDDSLAAVARDDGLTAVSWHRDGLAYVAVSELPIADLTAIAEHFRQQEAS